MSKHCQRNWSLVDLTSSIVIALCYSRTVEMVVFKGMSHAVSVAYWSPACLAWSDPPPPPHAKPLALPALACHAMLPSYTSHFTPLWYSSTLIFIRFTEYPQPLPNPLTKYILFNALSCFCKLFFTIPLSAKMLIMIIMMITKMMIIIGIVSSIGFFPAEDYGALSAHWGVG